MSNNFFFTLLIYNCLNRDRSDGDLVGCIIGHRDSHIGRAHISFFVDYFQLNLVEVSIWIRVQIGHLGSLDLVVDDHLTRTGRIGRGRRRPHSHSGHVLLLLLRHNVIRVQIRIISNAPIAVIRWGFIGAAALNRISFLAHNLVDFKLLRSGGRLWGMFTLMYIGLVFGDSLHIVKLVVVILVAHNSVFAAVYPNGVLLAVLTLLLPKQLLLLSDLLMVDRIAVVLVEILVVDALLEMFFARGRRDVTLAVVAVVEVVVGDFG